MRALASKATTTYPIRACLKLPRERTLRRSVRHLQRHFPGRNHWGVHQRQLFQTRFGVQQSLHPTYCSALANNRANARSHCRVKPARTHHESPGRQHSIRNSDRHCVRFSLRCGTRTYNGQLTLQYAPSKDLKFTVDYTMADNTTNKEHRVLLVQLPRCPPLGPIGPPRHLTYSAMWPNNHDLALGGGEYEKAQMLYRLQRRVEGHQRPETGVRRTPVHCNNQAQQPVRNLRNLWRRHVQPRRRNRLLR